MININDIIETALAVDALQTHVSTDAIGVDARLRPAMERCAPAALAAVYAVSADADVSAEPVRSALEMLGAYRYTAARTPHVPSSMPMLPPSTPTTYATLPAAAALHHMPPHGLNMPLIRCE